MKQFKEYRYKGYTFRRTCIICGNNGQNLYEIEDLKSVGKQPFLTSIRECKEYIDYAVAFKNGGKER